MINEYQFTGLSSSEVLDPKLPKGIKVEEVENPSGSLGDIPNYIISFSTPLLAAVVTYLLQKRKTTRFKQKYIEIHPNGKRVEKTIEYSHDEKDGAGSETISKIVDQISKMN